MRCFDTMTVQSHSSSKLMLRREDSGLHCCKPMTPSHSPENHWQKKNVAKCYWTRNVGHRVWTRAIPPIRLRRHVEVHTDHKPLESIYTKHIFAAPPSYSAYNSTTWASSTFLAVMSNWQMHYPGWTHVTRDLSEALTCLCTNYTCILMRVQLVLWKFAWKHRKTVLCMRHVRSYHSAGQRTEHIARRIWCPSGIFETNWVLKMDWYWKVNALYCQSPYTPQH